MTSSASLTTSATYASMLALTTPFIPPPGCADIFTTTGTIQSDSWDESTSTSFNVVYSDPSNARFTQCQPRGWDKVDPQSRFHFSPAVCPDQWTAYSLQDVRVSFSTPYPSWRVATTAYCCARGYTLDELPVSLKNLDSLACISTFSDEPTATSSTISSGPVPLVIQNLQVHNAYQISWGVTDKATLSPTPPDFGLGCSTTLKKWVPGESVGSLPCNTPRQDNWGGNSSYAFFICIIVIPIVLVVLISLCCCSHFRHKREERAEREQRRQDRSRRQMVGSQEDPPSVQLENIKT